MKKQLFTLLGGTLFASAIYAQQQPVHNQTCNTYGAMEDAFKADPNLKAKYNLVQSQLELEYQSALAMQQQGRPSVASYTIPVVFHIMGPQTIPDQVFIDAIAQVNRDYGRAGSDTGTVYPNFKSIYVDAQMVFALAKKDPNGNCTNGIIHHNADNSYWNQGAGISSYKYSGTGTSRWPTTQYLNVYVVECIYSTSQGINCPTASGTLYLGGYTYLPGSAPGTNADAIVYRTSELNGLSARALSHEMGHWFNLQHTFGNTNSPGMSCGNDNISDTPPTTGVQSMCPASNSNTCATSSGLWNVENFMDYSSCPKNFTQGQVTAIRAAAASSTAGRNNLWSTANLSATGLAPGYTCTPVANFNANKQSVCAGSTVTFSNTSQVGTSGSVNWSFDGGTPATSTSNTTSVTYSTPGTYSVVLTATNPSGSNTTAQTSYITVVQGGAGLLVPFTHDFDSGNLPGINVINGNSGTVAWALNTGTGANGTTQSIFLNNASQSSSAGQIDIFETPIYNFASSTNISLSYYYAYAKKITTQADTFKLQYSTDCGGTWTNVLGFANCNTMAANSGSITSASFSPSAAQWKQVNIASTLLTALNNKPSVKFRFWFKSDKTAGSSNNIFIDQINVSGTVGLNELENKLGLAVYPNPTNASATVDLNTYTNEKVKITVMDVVGRVVEEANTLAVDGTKGSYTVNKNASLAKGIYIINIDVNNQKISKKLIIE